MASDGQHTHSARDPPARAVHIDPVLVVDFGAQYAQLIARRVRECHVYSEIVPYTATTAEHLARKPKAIILSGGPKSVYSPAPRPSIRHCSPPAFRCSASATAIR